jgi:aspartyl-tRNA(Asn)/glutamyl-tRNA(Gln) amidotransferase subunit C
LWRVARVLRVGIRVFARVLARVLEGPTVSDSSDLSAADVRHIATLVRIGMTDQDVEKFRVELSSIIGHCNSLAAIDTEDVEPTMNGAFADRGGDDGMADDVAEPCFPVEDVMANAPVREDDYLRVRGVLG